MSQNQSSGRAFRDFEIPQRHSRSRRRLRLPGCLDFRAPLRPLNLGDVYNFYGYKPKPADLKLAIRFFDRTIEMCDDDEDLSLLNEVYQKLVDTLDAIDAD